MKVPLACLRTIPHSHFPFIHKPAPPTARCFPSVSFSSTTSCLPELAIILLVPSIPSTPTSKSTTPPTFFVAPVTPWPRTCCSLRKKSSGSLRCFENSPACRVLPVLISISWRTTISYQSPHVVIGLICAPLGNLLWRVTEPEHHLRLRWIDRRLRHQSAAIHSFFRG